MGRLSTLKAELEKWETNRDLAMAGGWKKPKIDLAKELWQKIHNIKAIESDIENLQHSDDKLADAEKHYNDVLANMSEEITKAESEIKEIQKTLNKDWREYANKKGRWSVGKENPRANQCYHLSENIESARRDIDYAREEMLERRKMLENFPDLIADAEKRIDIAREDAKNYEYLINRRIAELEQKIKAVGDTDEQNTQSDQKKPQTYTIRYEFGCFAGRYCYVINKDDVIEVANNGTRGISFLNDGKYLVSIPKSYLKAITKELKCTDYCIVYEPKCGLDIKWSSRGRYRFTCIENPCPHRDTVFTEALCDIKDKP
jgi:predicted  nucleic acid-binding Zn-ribbon protein